MAAILTLNCFAIYNADSFKAFPVEVRHAGAVGILKDAIKQKLQNLGPTFAAFATGDIELSNVSQFKFSDDDDDLAEKIAKLNLPQARPLRPVLKLSKVFQDVSDDDEHIHVIVRPSLDSMPQRILTITCYVVENNSVVLSDALKNAFLVKIADTETVSALKDLIKEKKKPVLDHIAADTLSLWKVPIPVDLQCTKTVADLKLTEEAILPATKTLSQLFPTALNKDFLHIVVRSPSTSSKPSLPSDDIGALTVEFFRKYKPTAPSSQGLPQNFQNHQDRSDNVKLYCSRPPDASATIPVTLMHPTFGQFMDDCETYTPIKEDNEAALKLSRKMSTIFTTEDLRAKSVRKVFAKYGITLLRTKIEDTGYETDGDVNDDGLRYVILEVKNEVGSKGAEPYLQSGFYYLESVREILGKNADVMPDSVLPCLIILVFGPYICFAGAAWGHGHPSLQVLSPALPLYFHHTDTKARIRLARHLGSAKRAIATLREYYRVEFPIIIESKSRPRRRYPYRKHFTSLADNTQQQFEYTSMEEGNLVFFGKLVGSGDTICIKFARHYSKEAHVFCADHGAAPQLLGFENIPGGWHMVVMESIKSSYVNYYDMHYLPNFNAAHAPLIHDEIRARLEELHAAGYVHGDIRDVNIMVAQSGDAKPMLVDFDWAGEIDNVRYPMNVFNDAKQGLWRPTGAEDAELITAEHDMQMLEKIFQRLAVE